MNTELINAFARLDRDHDGKIDRQEFARVHVNDAGQQQGEASTSSRSAAQGASSTPPSRSIEERSKFSSGEKSSR